MNNKVNVTDVNEAIIHVLTHMKKECPKDFALVESMGYDVRRHNDHYTIVNGRKYLAISEKQYDSKRNCLCSTIRLGSKRDKFVPAPRWNKVNFVAFLESPVNDNYYSTISGWNNLHASQKWRDIFSDFHWAKQEVKYAQEYVDDSKKNIEREIDRLQYRMEQLAKAQAKVMALRKEHGLVSNL